MYEWRVGWCVRYNGCLDSRHWRWTRIILLFNIFGLCLGLIVHHVNLGWDNVRERFGDKRLSGAYLALAWTLRCWRPAGQWPAVFHQPPTVLCNNTDYIQPGQSCCGFNRRKGVQWRNGEISERTFPKKNRPENLTNPSGSKDVVPCQSCCSLDALWPCCPQGLHSLFAGSSVNFISASMTPMAFCSSFAYIFAKSELKSNNNQISLVFDERTFGFGRFDLHFQYS